MKDLLELIRAFNRARDWDAFHTPKNLAMAVVAEAAELLEPFLWLTPQQSRRLDRRATAQVRDEIGDVLICLVNLCDKLGVDPVACARAKLEKNAERYPVERSRGSARKYTDSVREVGVRGSVAKK